MIVNKDVLRLFEEMRDKWNNFKQINYDFNLKHVSMQFRMCDGKIINIETDNNLLQENTGRIYKFIGNPYYHALMLNGELVDLMTITKVFRDIWENRICGYDIKVGDNTPWTPVGSWEIWVHGVIVDPWKRSYDVRVETKVKPSIIDGTEYAVREYGKHMELE